VLLLSWRGEVAGDLLVRAYLVLLVAAVLMAVVSLAISSLCKLSSTAMVIAYPRHARDGLAQPSCRRRS